jgi:hypothetical protein
VPGADDVSAPVSTSNGDGQGDGYVWFEDVRVFLDGLSS